MKARTFIASGAIMMVLVLINVPAIAGTTARDIMNCGFSWGSVVDALTTAVTSVYGSSVLVSNIIAAVAAGMPIWMAIALVVLAFGVSIYIAYRIWSVFQAYMAARNCRVSR